MYKHFSLVGAILLLNTVVTAQPKTDQLLQDILYSNKEPLFTNVLRHPDSFRLQIIYTQINRDKHNQPIFKNYYFHYDPELYFNPASLVKLPLAFLSLEKLNSIHNKEVNKYTTILFDSTHSWQQAMHRDTTAISGYPTIAHLIKRALLVSENDPYNRMYQFVGQQEINQNLHNKGYKDVKITRQFLGLTPEQNKYTNPIRFISKKGELIHEQPEAVNAIPFDFSRSIKLGDAHFDRNDSLVNEPFDFTVHNSISLETMQQLLQSVMFPNSVALNQRFDLTEDDYQFLYRYLSQYPSETPEPKYDTLKFYDSYVKFSFRNNTKKIPSYIRVFNKVGWSYGFVSDVSYVIDTLNNIEFMLAATLYVNSDGVINDGKYEYNTVGYPFLYQLGQTVYNYELKRRREYKPDLSSFKISYERRDANDTKPSLNKVDN